MSSKKNQPCVSQDFTNPLKLTISFSDGAASYKAKEKKNERISFSSNVDDSTKSDVCGFPTTTDSSGHTKYVTSQSLYIVLSHLHDQLVRRDGRGIFAHPVTDEIAIGYSKVITNPMDLGTIYKRLCSRLHYARITDYLADVSLMCNNAMVYNPPNTIYYQRARKLLVCCKKQLDPQLLRKTCQSLNLPVDLSADEMNESVLLEILARPTPKPELCTRRTSSSVAPDAKFDSISSSPLYVSNVTTPTPPKLPKLELSGSPLRDEPDERCTDKVVSPLLKKVSPVSTNESVTEAPLVIKRPRGRPRKYPLIESSVEKSTSLNESSTLSQSVLVEQSSDEWKTASGHTDDSLVINNGAATPPLSAPPKIVNTETPVTAPPKASRPRGRPRKIPRVIPLATSQLLSPDESTPPCTEHSSGPDVTLPSTPTNFAFDVKLSLTPLSSVSSVISPDSQPGPALSNQSSTLSLTAASPIYPTSITPLSSTHLAVTTTSTPAALPPAPFTAPLVLVPSTSTIHSAPQRRSNRVPKTNRSFSAQTSPTLVIHRAVHKRSSHLATKSLKRVVEKRVKRHGPGRPSLSKSSHLKKIKNQQSSLTSTNAEISTDSFATMEQSSAKIDEFSSSVGNGSGESRTVEEVNEVLLQAREMADLARSRFHAKHAVSLKRQNNKMGGLRTVYLHCSKPGEVLAVDCPNACSIKGSRSPGDDLKSSNSILSDTEKSFTPDLKVNNPSILTQVLTGARPKLSSIETVSTDSVLDSSETSKRPSVPLIDPFTFEEMETLKGLAKLKYNTTEPIGAAIHGPLSDYSVTELTHLSEVYGSDPAAIEYALSLLRFVQPIGRWARRWATKRLDLATDGLHSRFLTDAQAGAFVAPMDMIDLDSGDTNWTQYTIDFPTPPCSPKSMNYNPDKFYTTNSLLQDLGAFEISPDKCEAEIGTDSSSSFVNSLLINNEPLSGITVTENNIPSTATTPAVSCTVVDVETPISEKSALIRPVSNSLIASSETISTTPDFSNVAITTTATGPVSYGATLIISSSIPERSSTQRTQPQANSDLTVESCSSELIIETSESASHPIEAKSMEAEDQQSVVPYSTEISATVCSSPIITYNASGCSTNSMLSSSDLSTMHTLSELLDSSSSKLLTSDIQKVKSNECSVPGGRLESLLLAQFDQLEDFGVESANRPFTQTALDTQSSSAVPIPAEAQHDLGLTCVSVCKTENTLLKSSPLPNLTASAVLSEDSISGSNEVDLVRKSVSSNVHSPLLSTNLDANIDHCSEKSETFPDVCVLQPADNKSETKSGTTQQEESVDNEKRFPTFTELINSTDKSIPVNSELQQQELAEDSHKLDLIDELLDELAEDANKTDVPINTHGLCSPKTDDLCDTNRFVSNEPSHDFTIQGELVKSGPMEAEDDAVRIHQENIEADIDDKSEIVNSFDLQIHRTDDAVGNQTGKAFGHCVTLQNRSTADAIHLPQSEAESTVLDEVSMTDTTQMKPLHDQATEDSSRCTEDIQLCSNSALIYPAGLNALAETDHDNGNLHLSDPHSGNQASDVSLVNEFSFTSPSDLLTDEPTPPLDWLS